MSDAAGRPILGLKKSDFVLIDRKTQQVSDAFAPHEAGVIDAILPLNDLLPGSYVLRVGCSVAPDAATREIGFVVK